MMTNVIKNFLNTPNGRPGWADYFLRFGYRVYLTDPTQRGRSPTIPGEEGGIVGIVAAKDTEQYFTASSRYPDLWPQARLHTQWPGTGLRGDPVFDAFYASQVQLTTNSTLSDMMNRRAEIDLLERIGPAIIVTHSQSGPWGWALADARPDLVKGIVAIEPEGPPFVNEAGPTGPPRTWGLTRLPVKYEPEVLDPDKDLPTEVVPAPPGKERDLRPCTRQKEPVKKLANLSKVPVLLINGEASFHAPFEYCTYGFLKQAGVNAEWLDLGAKGIKGNGHFLFMEKNSLRIAAEVQKWLSKAEGHGDLLYYSD